MQNSSSLSIDYCIKLESLSLLRHAKSQDLPSFIQGDAEERAVVGK